MSAIFGVYNLDQRPVDQPVMGIMSHILSHRGSDGAGLLIEKNISFGHRMLWTTAESLDEQLPKSFGLGNLWITADARIDNREELLEKLEISPAGTLEKTISDSEIILYAYEKWGADCPEKLLGDFAFAIWDRKQRRLFCARDHFGIKPFYYYASENCFAFATEIKALFCLKNLPRTLNPSMIADYLIGNFEDKEATFYANVLRLPPGHSITVTPGDKRVREYYRLDPQKEAEPLSDAEYSEKLRVIFTEAVRCRMRSVKPIGAFLSGGLDSSSISCVARDLLKAEAPDKLLSTFSLIYDRQKECDERKYINQVLVQGGFDPHFRSGDADAPLSNLEAICRHADRPVIGPGHSSSWEFHKIIRQTGTRVILDGHDGDSAVSYGYKYLDELASSGRWYSLALEARALAPVFSMTQLGIVKAYVRRYRWKPFLKKHPQLKRIERFGRRFTKVKSGRSFSELGEDFRDSVINADFAEKMNLGERQKIVQRSSPEAVGNARESHFRSLTSGRQVFGLEEYDSISAAFGIETRYPFWDKRLIEYCLSLPGEQKCRRGWNRVVMRRAMNRILPPEVCWRRDKTDFTPNFIEGLTNFDKEKFERLLTTAGDQIGEIFDPTGLKKLCENFNSKSPDAVNVEGRAGARLIWDISSLLTWLDRSSSAN